MEVDNSLNHIDIDIDTDTYTYIYICADETGYLPDEEESIYRVGSIVYCLEQEFLFHNIPILHVICNHMFYISTVHLSVRNFGPNFNETICVLLQA